ncbi:hypothetical protein, partial [Pseudomonas syringae]
MFEAARFGDEISHTGALGGFLIGAVLGIALIATVAIATFTCGCVAAARKGDKLTCGATISGGSDNVFIGGGRYRYLPVDDEIPGWLRTTVDVLMAVAGAAGGIAQLIKAGTQAGMKAVLPCALKFTAGFVAGEVGSRYVVEP